MVTVSEFMEEQNRILERDFRRSSIGQEGTASYTNGDEGKVFYGVLLWHPYDISRRVEEVSYKIAGMVPSVTCDAGDVHVGVVVYNGHEDGETVLKKLAEAARRVKKDLRSPITIYDGWFYNRNSVIAAGTGDDAIDDAFVDIINGLLDNYDGEGLIRKYLAQITSNRFLERRTPEELRQAGFFEHMKRLPRLGESRPKQLGVIKQTIGGSRSVIKSYEIFDLPS